MKKLLKKLKKLFKQKKGFTLIELLVVIGILGILAAALVATIDPFEQLKKANDANTKNVLVEFLDANVRYYADHSAYPWDAAGAGCNGATAPVTTSVNAGMVLCGTNTTVPNTTCTSATISDCITSLVSVGELKAGFQSALGSLSQVYITYYPTATTVNGSTVNSNTIVGCFLPTSVSEGKSNIAVYKQNGDADTGCMGNCPVGSTCTKVCYWCTR
ncbi:MAG TPA: type II secretion system protein [Patescibacteria group bacterium]|jgi:type IV pilus assembly protein PilA|nr:type II secretion system protein [Patescibacteria group bacterium]